MNTSNPKLNKDQTTKGSSEPAKTMADLMKAVKPSVISLKKGEILKGKITKLTPSEILVDINAKSFATVLEKDKKILRNLLSSLKVGEEVNVSVLNPESDKGNPVVSLRRYIEEISWRRLANYKENKKEIEISILEITKGGFWVTTEEGIQGFLPNSHTLPGINSDILGKKIKAFILELNPQDKKITFSQKAVLGEEDFKKTIKNLKIEQKVDAIVTNITPFGIFVSLQTNEREPLDGLVHISEMSWDRVENISDLFSVGQKIEAVIIAFDNKAKRVDLSMKKLMKDPFEKVADSFSVDQKISGTVSKILPTGVIVEISIKDEQNPSTGSGQAIEGFIRKEKIPPTVSYKTGENIKATVSQVDKKKHRIILIPILKEKPIGYR